MNRSRPRPALRAALFAGLLGAALATACTDDPAEPAADAALDLAPPVLGDAARLDAADPDAAPDTGTGADAAPDAAPDLAPDAPADRDGDGVPDGEDAFPDDPDEWLDRDGDGTGDNTDPFPTDPTEWIDRDNDGIGDNEDLDDDADGIPDLEEMAYGDDCAVSDPLRADTDDDGIGDADDPYPRDPFPEFLVRANDAGTIDLFLSNRDGTFVGPTPVGQPLEHEGTPLAYTGFSVGDFDGDGIMDFLAHTTPYVDGEPTRGLWLFVRDDKADEFRQRFIGETDDYINGVVADLDGDFDFDIARVVIRRDGNVSGGEVVVYLNTGRRAFACAADDAPDSECMFTRLPPQDITATIGGQWIARGAFQAVDLDPQNGGHVDLTVTTYANGGNASTQIYTLFGAGDGTFGPPQRQLTHNANGRQAPANTVMFADFNGDGIGDVCLGFDDDGRPGEAWTYLGVGDGSFFDQPIDAVDLNPGDAREDNETLGRTSSGRTFDFDFDGAMDLIVGYDHHNYSGPGQTRIYRGNGNGTFGPDFEIVGPDSMHRHGFAIPQRRCARFAARPMP